MTDVQFTEWLREHAREYNTPPVVPAEVVWSRIAEDVEGIVGRRAASRPGAGTVRALRRTPVSAYAAAVMPRRWMPTAVGVLVATAVLAGFVLGRFSADRGPRAADLSRAFAAASPATPPAQPRAPDPAQILPAPTAHVTAPLPSGADALPRGAATAPRGKRAATPRASPPTPERVLAHLPSLPRPGESAAEAGAARDPGSVYAMTRDSYFAASETLLSAFRTDVKAGRIDPTLARTARDLLVRTRVLYDSPATRDPQMKALLGDLELILIQLSTYRPGRTSDLRMASLAIDESGVLPRLRDASAP